MKTYIFRRLFIILLSLALLNGTVIRTFATDSDHNESGSETHEPSDGSLMYAGSGTWIQGADCRWWYRHADGTYTTSDWEYIDGNGITLMRMAGW